MAATFFGEVVKAPCRAGTEDDEEEEEEEEEEGRRETPEDREVRQQLARKSISVIICYEFRSLGGSWLC
ncbi:PSMG1 isoform 5 [Pongo abelii]|uniref:PSMG1 isoform 5 n=1 Tax=Pongo abelii TaxID=9601 RepID=A0A2J8UAP9_PONAB|nr:PSMG1 isoform 5 [Pongo abelii]